MERSRLRRKSISVPDCSRRGSVTVEPPDNPGPVEKGYTMRRLPVRPEPSRGNSIGSEID